MYPTEAKWISHDPTFIYPLQESFSNTSSHFHPNDSFLTRVAVCASCLKLSTRCHSPKVDKVPIEIQEVPILIVSIYLLCI